MRVKSLLRHTSREKLVIMDAMSLFFGALIGANLGTLAGVPLKDYVLLIVLLAGMVMTIRWVTLSERRLYALATHLFYLLLLGLFLYHPTMRIDGVADGDRDRLAATILIWAGMTLAIEFYPSQTEEPDASEPAPKA